MDVRIKQDGSMLQLSGVVDAFKLDADSDVTVVRADEGEAGRESVGGWIFASLDPCKVWVAHGDEIDTTFCAAEVTTYPNNTIVTPSGTYGGEIRRVKELEPEDAY